MEAQRIAHLRQDDWVVCVKDFSRAPGQLDAQLCSDWPGLLDGMAAEPNPIHEQMFGKLDVQNCLSTYQSERAINVVFRQQDFMRRL